jgi:hypothetical protein
MAGIGIPADVPDTGRHDAGRVVSTGRLPARISDLPYPNTFLMPLFGLSAANYEAFMAQGRCIQ